MYGTSEIPASKALETTSYFARIRQYYIVNEQLCRGIIEAVDSPVGKRGRFEPSYQVSIHYLPHHAVIHQDKQTTKVRIVYDRSARSAANSFSLNDYLMTGPNLIPKLFNILVKFRWNLIALTADIEKAVLMIGIHSGDRDVLRFLWFKEPCNPDSEVTHFRFTRLVFGLRPISSNFEFCNFSSSDQVR